MTFIGVHAKESARLLGVSYDELDSKDTFNNWTLEAYRQILISQSWVFSERAMQPIVTVAGTPDYVLASNTADVSHVLFVDSGGKKELLPNSTQFELALKGIHDDGNDAQPVAWDIHKYDAGLAWISFTPVPDAVYNYDVYASTDGAFATSSLEFKLPDALLPLVRAHVNRSYYLNIGDLDKYRLLGEEYDRIYRLAVKRYTTMASRQYKFSYSDVPASLGGYSRIPNTIIDT